MKKRKFGKIDAVIAAFFRTERESIPNDVQMEIIRTRIVSVVQKSGAKKVYLSGVCQNEAVQKYIVTIQERLRGDVEFISYGASILNNVQSLKNLIESKGGKVTGSVTSKTSFLINNDTMSASSKNKKAKELGVKIISEEDFIEQFNK